MIMNSFTLRHYVVTELDFLSTTLLLCDLICTYTFKYNFKEVLLQLNKPSKIKIPSDKF